jgi:hypothetical protein
MEVLLSSMTFLESSAYNLVALITQTFQKDTKNCDEHQKQNVLLRCVAKNLVQTSPVAENKNRRIITT